MREPGGFVTCGWLWRVADSPGVRVAGAGSERVLGQLAKKVFGESGPKWRFCWFCLYWGAWSGAGKWLCANRSASKESFTVPGVKAGRGETRIKRRADGATGRARLHHGPQYGVGSVRTWQVAASHVGFAFELQPSA